MALGPLHRCPVCKADAVPAWYRLFVAFGGVLRCTACGSGLTKGRSTAGLVGLAASYAFVLAGIYFSFELASPIPLVAFIVLAWLCFLFVPVSVDLDDPVTRHKRTKAMLRSAKRGRKAETTG